MARGLGTWGIAWRWVPWVFLLPLICPDFGAGEAYNLKTGTEKKKKKSHEKILGSLAKELWKVICEKYNPVSHIL